MKWEVRLFTANYEREEDDITVKLFGRTKNNESIVVLAKDFFPYFYVTTPPNEIGKLAEDERVIKTEKKILLVKSKEIECTKVTIKFPWVVPDFRREYSNFTFLAADIPFFQRFIYDKDLGSCFAVYGEKIENNRYTTEIVVKAEKFENITSFTPKLKILSFDIENSINTGRIYTICSTIRMLDGSLKKEEFYDKDEKQIIKNFIKIVNKYDPDVITGYNIDGYDIPLLLKRAEFLNLKKLKLGRDQGELRSINDRFWRLHGRIIADAWWNAKNELRPKKETLNHIAKILLGEEKIDVNPIKIDEEWAKDQKKVVEYCLKDAELALRILEKIVVLEKSMDLAAVSKLPLDDVINGRTSTLIDSILIREADRANIGVPMTKHKKKTSKIEGGYVFDVEPGLYHWVCVLDFKSMYPSLMISKNICFTTLSPNGEILSPIGARFLNKDIRQGLVPKILENLMRERDEIKEKMKRTEDSEEIRYLDGLQNAIKILMNSFYGVFASTFYRFTDQKIGASITAFARENIKGIIKKLQSEGVNVIYSDTDSIFFQSTYENLDKTIDFGNKISQRFSKEGAVLEFEKILEPFFTHGKKKRYIGKIIWPNQDTVIRGYETRRTDSFNLQSETLMNVFNQVLNDNIGGAIDVARATISTILKGKVPIDSLVISRTCKEFSYYKNPDRQAWVQTAKKMIKLGYNFIPGMKVSWIVTNSKKTPQEVEPYIDGRDFAHKPDWNYYAHRVALSVARVTEIYNWDAQALQTGISQRTLFSESFSKPKVEKEKPKSVEKENTKKVEKEGKKLTLEDFL